MDPSMVAVPLAASAVELHTAPAANPTPSAVTNHGATHPTYAEMITAAIAALKDKNGSSRRAIAKYIEDTYTNLPNTHSALLTHHLKRLKTNGVVLMVKHSYKLPRSGAAGPTASPAAAGSKRGAGRPPKSRPSADPIPDAQADHPSDLNPTFVALGLADEPIAEAAVQVQQQPKRGRGRPPKFGTPMSKGRPASAGTAAGLNSVEGKRSRGRPRKERPSLLESTVVRVLSVKRRGRPPGSGGARKPKKLSARPVGRPRKSNIASAQVLSALGQQSQLPNHGEFKLKFQHFQSKIKEAVGVLRPYIAGQGDGSAPVFAALQDLEELAELDVVAPMAAVQVPLL